MSTAYGRHGNHAAAVFWAKQAVQSQAGAPDGPALAAAQMSLVAQLLAEARTAEAQQVLQMIKEQELFDTLGTTAATDPRVTALPWTAVEQELAARAGQLEREQRALRARGTTQGLPQGLLNARMGEIERRRLTLLDEIEMRLQAAPPPDPARPPSRFERSLQALVRDEPAVRAVGLQYVVQADGVWIIVTPPGAAPESRFVAVERRQLETGIRALRLQMSQPSSRLDLLQAAAADLHRVLIAPVRERLRQFDTRTLMVSVTGPLRYLPFAALHDGQRYLIEDFGLAFYNEAVDPPLPRASPVRWRIAAMGLSQPVDDLRALVAVPEETHGVIAQPNMQGTVYLNADFDLPRLQFVLRNSAPSYNVLHVASHFVLEPRRAAHSRLYLGDGSRLTLTDLTTGRWRLDHLDLLTLSACETALPGLRDAATGEEIESLGARVQLLGAQAVLATLWKVNDRSTAEFMQAFYRIRGSTQVSKAAALRAAQIGFLGRTGGEQAAPWAHPFFWAPFILMGNGR